MAITAKIVKSLLFKQLKQEEEKRKALQVYLETETKPLLF